MEKMKKNKKIINKIISIIVTLIFIILALTVGYLAFQILTKKEPQLFGYRFYIVVTDSMTPELEIGDVILSKAIKNPENLEVGNIVSFKGTSGTQNGLLITHKIVISPYTGSDGKTYIRTQGTKAGAPVDDPVLLENVKAIMVREMAVISYIYKLTRSPVGFFFVIFIPFLLLITYEVIKITKAKSKKQIEKAKEQNNSDK